MPSYEHGPTLLERDVDDWEPLELPEYRATPLAPNGYPSLGSSGFYGAADVAASYCGLPYTPGYARGYWQHGWTASYRMPIPPDLILGCWARRDETYWVARKDEEEHLRSCGFPDSRAIGMPMIYLPPGRVRRRPDSLLVMPAHTLDYVTCSWKFDEYAEAIAAIRHEFSEVVVSVSPPCWRHGYWVDAFRSRGFHVIPGADASDRNALERVRYLLSRFEYMVTNGFGSHIAYAYYFGAKPSVYGPYATRHAEDFAHDVVLRRDPRLLPISLRSFSEEELRRNRPQLFGHPRDAREDVEWGRFQLGEDNKVSPGELRDLFGWSIGARLRRKLVSRTPGTIKHWARMASTPSYRAHIRESRRLAGMPHYQPTTTTLLGRPFEVLNVPSFLENKSLLFDQEMYRFGTSADVPRIIDCGAGVGLAVCFFKYLYPEGEVTAFEPDPGVFEVLKRNCETWGAGDVRLIPKAVWTGEDTLPFRRDGHYSGRLDDRSDEGDLPRVPTCRLRDYLDSPVDLLRLDIQGAEVEVLLDCADRLGNVRHLVVDHHSYFGRPQRLAEVVETLTRAGFRLHFRAFPHSSHPFLYPNLKGGIDSHLQVLAFRE